MQTSIIIVVALVLLLAISYKLYEDFRDNKLIALVTSKNRGNDTEHKFVLQLLKNKITSDNIFHDVYFKRMNGKYTQTDVIILTNYGLIVVEIKNYSGWIFGDGNNKYWTKVLNYGKEKYKFYNPILQNKSHISSLKEQSQISEEIPIISVIVFYGDCALKSITNIPENTFVIYPNKFFEIIDYIESFYTLINLDKLVKAKQILKQGVQNGDNFQIVEEHAKYVAEITQNI